MLRRRCGNDRKEPNRTSWTVDHPAPFDYVEPESLAIDPLIIKSFFEIELIQIVLNPSRVLEGWRP
jgi:hypothetical protein